MKPMVIELPWPDKGLSPNARVHWAVKARLKRDYRAVCAWKAKAQGAHRLTGVESLHALIAFFPPDRRKRDRDNMLGSIKSGLDGLADVLGVDDSEWFIAFDKKTGVGGFVRIEITEGEC